jgi:putative DNA primase/helicase
MVDITHIFGGAFIPPTRREPDPPEWQLRQAMQDAGLEPPDSIELDGVIHRFNTDHRKDKTGWYVAYSDNVPAGRFGCWRRGIEHTWRADLGRDLTAIEQMQHARRMQEAKTARDAAKAKQGALTQDSVLAIWSDLVAASPEHPYLVRKGISPNGLRVTGDGRLCSPIYDADRTLISLQYIDGSGDKRFHPGAPVRGGYWWVGNLDEPGTLYIAEGIATAATIHQVTGRPVAITYSAGNIPQVARIMRERYGQQQEIVIVADQDESGTGERYAREAAQEIGARVIIPPAGDANDFHQSGGDLLALLDPPSGWFIHADYYIKQPAPIRWVIKRWIQQDALVMLHGPSGGGKTFVLLDMLCSVAGGLKEWAGNIIKPGPVVALVGEGHLGVRGRIAAWMQERRVKHLDMWLSPEGVDLNTPQGYTKAADHIRALKVRPSIISVDTLHRHFAGDENSAQDAKTMLDACGGLMREFGCAVVLVHHTGVSEEAQHRARGSSAWRGALDIEISVIPAKDDAPMEIVQRKSKDAELASPIYCELKQVDINGWIDEDGEQVNSAIIELCSAPAKKEDVKTSEYVKDIKRAWHYNNCTLLNDSPYISRQGLKEWLINNKGYTESTAKDYMKAGKKRMIGTLIDAGIIADHQGGGWVVVDAGHASAMLVSM